MLQYHLKKKSFPALTNFVDQSFQAVAQMAFDKRDSIILFLVLWFQEMYT